MLTYFILSPQTNRIKIGRAADPEKRLQNLQVGNPDDLELALTLPHVPPFEEHQLHWRFRDYRGRGEWFEHRGDLAQFVKEKKKNPRPTAVDDKALQILDGGGEKIGSYEYSKADNKLVHNPEKIGYTDDCQRPHAAPFRSLAYDLYPVWPNRDDEVWTPPSWSPKEGMTKNQ